MPDVKSATHLPRRRLLSYATASVGYGMIDLPMTVLVLFFYTDVVKLDPALAGYGMLAGNLVSAIFDPALGHLSDRTRTVLGRRRPFLLASAVPLAIAFFLLWTPFSASHPFANFALVYVATFMCLTTFLVPYNSLAAELTPDYDERTRIQGYRESGHIIGLLIGFLFLFSVEKFDNLRTGYSVMGAIFGVAVAAGIFITLLAVRENPAFQRPPQVGAWEGLRLAVSNRHFLWLVATFVPCNIGLYIPTIVIKHALKYWLNAGDVVLLTYIVASVASLPFWVWLSSKITKKWAYLTALGCSMVATGAIFFLQPGLVILLFIVFAIAGAGYGALMILPISILADIVDYDELKTGERREGTYFGAWAFLQKVTVAGAAALVGATLTRIGLVPDQEQSPATIAGMRILMALVPAALLLVSSFVLLPFPFTREVHQKVQETLRQRAANHA